MRRTWLLAVSLLAVLFAGCVSDEPPAPTTEAPAETLYADDRITIQNISAAPLQAPTLEEAPQWRLGEWWDIEVTEFFAGETHTSTIVVAGAEAADFLVGMPTHDFSNGLMVLHIPGIGQVARNNLSYEIHDCRFSPLEFPLTLGKTWDTQFECGNVTAEVIDVTPTTATVELVGDGGHITLTYDADMRTITHFLALNYAEYRITDHGSDFHLAHADMEGLVTVPHMHDVIFMHGRVLGALGAGGPLPAPVNAPFDTIEVSTTYDRVSFVMATGNAWGLVPNGLGSASPAGGYYRLTATAPDGTEYVLEQMPVDPRAFQIAFLKHDAPGGVWEFEHIATGPGLTSAEGIAYHVYDVELPTGRILPSIGEHKHGEGEGH